MTSERREPRPLRDSLASVSRELGLPDPEAFGVATARWDGIVGDAIAEHARPRHLRDGVLTVEVDEGSWATQLRYLETDVVGRLAAEGVEVDHLRVVVTRPR